MFKQLMDQIVVEPMKPNVNLHACMDNIEEKVNIMFRELSILDLAKFMTELKQAQFDIISLKSPHK